LGCNIPAGVIVSVIKRKDELIIPRGDVVIEMDDILVLGAEPFEEHEHIQLKEIVLRKKNP